MNEFGGDFFLAGTIKGVETLEGQKKGEEGGENNIWI